MNTSKPSAIGTLVIAFLVTQASAQFPVTPGQVSQTMQTFNDSIPHDEQLLDKLYHARFGEIGQDKLDLLAVLKAFEASGFRIKDKSDLNPTAEQLVSIGRYFNDGALAAKAGALLSVHPTLHQTASRLASEGVDGEWAQTTYKNLIRLLLERASKPTINGPSDDSAEWAKQYPAKGSSLTIYSFKFREETPRSGLVEGDDHNFYGTTWQGGAKLMGTVFRLTPDGKLTTLHVFTGPDGGFPIAELVKGRDGNFYGTTNGTGLSGGGTVFRITPKGELTTLYNFSGDSPDGHQPMAALVLGRDGNFYGTTRNGGEGNTGGRGVRGAAGTVFKITPSGKLTILHSFKEGPGEATYPAGPLVEGNDGNFYGLTSQGGATAHEPTSYRRFPGDGAIYKITPAGEFSIIHSFGPNKKDGLTPVGGLAKGNDGNFYGVTESGGETAGIIFKVTQSGEFTNLRSFELDLNGGGVKPAAGLLKAKDGNFYGTTTSGGKHPASMTPPGTLFRFTPTNQYATLHSFQREAVPGSLFGHFLTEAQSKAKWAEQEAAAGRAHPELTEGRSPTTALMQAVDGNIYGTTAVGGAWNVGAVFKFDPRTVPKP